MRISVNFSALRKTKWYEYALRFVFGGAITVLAGLVAKEYGPVLRGRQAAALDAYGAGLGTVGLLGFAIIVWQFLRSHGAILVLSTATTVWTVVSLLLWRIRKSPLWP